jgi:hypothetical protein
MLVSAQIRVEIKHGKIKIQVVFACPCSSVDRALASGAKSDSSSLSRGTIYVEIMVLCLLVPYS